MILILGANGFIGSNLVNFLLKKKNKNILLSGSTNNKNKYSKYKFIKINLLNYKEFSKFDNFQITDIVFLAGISKSPIKNNNKNIFLHNKKIIQNTCRYFSKKKFKINNFIFASSVYVYSNNTLLFKEIETCKPNNFYGKSKLYSEEMILKTFNKKNLPNVFILRLFTVYGQNMHKNQFVYDLQRKFFALKNPVFFSENVFRNFIYVSDVLDIIYILLKQKKYKIIKEKFNIANKTSHSIGQIVKIFANKIKFNKTYTFKKNHVNDHNRSHFASIVKIKKYFGWEPKISIEKGIGKVIEHYYAKK